MSGTDVELFDQLDREWQELVGRGALERVWPSWSAQESALRSAHGVGDVLERLARRGTDSRTRDELLAALLRTAQRDVLAARLLLHRFTPFLRRLSTTAVPFERAEWVAILLGAAYEVIRTYPLDRRPDRIAANIGCDIRKRVYAALREYRRAQRELDSDPDAIERLTDLSAAPAFERAELSACLRSALRAGVLDHHTAQLLVLTRSLGFSVVQVAHATRETAMSLRQRRRRAELRLAAALAEAV